jgi:hypothetical protein
VQTIAVEEKLTVNMMNPQPQNSNTQPTSSKTTMAVGCEGGYQFEIKMAALIGLRGLQRGEEFELSSNIIDDAGNFDDIVYTECGSRRYFLQLKHADSSNAMMMNKTEQAKLLQKCFKSYCDIKYGDKFKYISIDKSEFIIYTNRKLSGYFKLRRIRETEVDIFFKTKDQEIFKLIPLKNKKRVIYTPRECREEL